MVRIVIAAALAALVACAAAPAAKRPGYTCGEATCATGEYCGHYAGGAVDRDTGERPHSDSCDALPAACAQTPTCECLRAAGVAFTSCDDGGGHPAISVLAP